MAPVELDRVADAFLLLRHRSRLPPSLRALRLPPSAVLSEIFAASAVWPLLGELELITEARLGPDWLGTLCGRESRARARRRRGNKGGLQQEADEPVPRGNSEGRLGDASRRGQVPRERFVCAAGRLVEALMGVEMEDVAEVGMRLAEAMADGACKEDSPWGGKGAEVLLAVGHGFHEAAGLLEGRRSLGRWAAARISMVVGDVAWSMRRFFTERRLAEVRRSTYGGDHSKGFWGSCRGGISRGAEG